MEDKKITEKESLEVITSMISRTKARYLGNGNILLMWGYLVTIIALLVWALTAITQNFVWNWLWYAIPLIGMPTTSVMSRRQHRISGAVTYSDRVTSRLWMIVSISEIALMLLCLGIYVIGDIYCWGAMFVYSIIIIPGAEIAQGLIVKEKCLVAGGLTGLTLGMVSICCVVGDIPLLYWWYMPLFIFAFVAMMIIPGHIINQKTKYK